jgi:hypothetical protein
LFAFSRNKNRFLSILDKLEKYALENYLNISPIQAVTIVNLYGHQMKNAELLSICEKVIVNGIEAILLRQDGLSSLLEAF